MNKAKWKILTSVFTLLLNGYALAAPSLGQPVLAQCNLIYYKAEVKNYDSRTGYFDLEYNDDVNPGLELAKQCRYKTGGYPWYSVLNYAPVKSLSLGYAVFNNKKTYRVGDTVYALCGVGYYKAELLDIVPNSRVGAYVKVKFINSEDPNVNNHLCEGYREISTVSTECSDLRNCQ